MAGDWIKMRCNLWDDPRVASMCDITDQPEAKIVGGLYWLWSTADQHTEDGTMPGLTLRAIDRKTGIPGFGQGLCDIGWLADHPEGVRIIKFEEHNGQSAKRRCTDAQRKANSRGVSALNADKIGTGSGLDEDEKRRLAELEKEKRRVERKKPPNPRKRGQVSEFPPGFDGFWSAYPRKKAKGAAIKAFARLRADDALQTAMLEAIARQSASDDWKRDGGKWIPYPATWLNDRRWEDQLPGVDDDPYGLRTAL